jgi:outer membrane protein, multidrug efflux system
MHRSIPLLAFSIFLYGCPRPSQYVRPELPVSSTWPESSSAGAAVPGATAATEVKWQEFFADPNLQSVIQLALENNRDLRMAALNIEKAQAIYQIQRSAQYPTVMASASGNIYRVPKTASGGDNSETVSQFTVGLGTTSWELDLFGRVRSLKESALEQYLATEQARSAAQISLISAVANVYLALAADRENLKLAQVTLDAQQTSYELIKQTSDAGIASELDVSQALSQVEAARADIARYTGQIAVDENALTLLVGAPVAANMLSNELGKVEAMKDIAAGLPSDLLLRRPDIFAAEHQLKAANANIGAARAAFFPRISLTAAAGIVSGDLTNLFKPAAGTWQFAPVVTLPIFDAGARKANYRAAEVDRDMAVAEYEKSIQSAFREVSDSLSLRTTLVAQQNALESLVNSLQKSYDLSEARYKGGIDNYLGVLVAQRVLYTAQRQLVSVRLARLINLVNMYKVLGGGGA